MNYWYSSYNHGETKNVWKTHTHTLDTSLWQTERPGNKDVLLTVIGTLHNENRLQGLLPTDPSNTRDVLIMIIQTYINT